MSMSENKKQQIVSAAIDRIDLMVDEFKRIKALAGSQSEITGLCERAISISKQSVPVIQQRDRAEAELRKQRDRAERAEAELRNMRNLPERLLMTRGNPNGHKLEELLVLICDEIKEKTAAIEGIEEAAAVNYRSANKAIIKLLTEAKRIQEHALSYAIQHPMKSK